MQFTEFFITTKIQILSELILQTSNFALQIEKIFFGVAAFRCAHYINITPYYFGKLFELFLLGNNCPLMRRKFLLQRIHRHFCLRRRLHQIRYIYHANF